VNAYVSYIRRKRFVEIPLQKMTKIGSDAFPFCLETFINNTTDIDVYSLCTADLGEFT
jgi:hypothetical protein